MVWVELKDLLPVGLGVLSVILVPVMAWFIRLEVRLSKNEDNLRSAWLEIKTLKSEAEKVRDLVGQIRTDIAALGAELRTEIKSFHRGDT